ncbi:MAG: RNA 2',3'-cyclic phosphodiesterase [Pseudomonadota bacterium]
MPRLFTGLEIPSLQATSLHLVQGGVEGMRWIEPSDFHITLRFIGDISPRVANDVVDAFDRKTTLKPWKAPNIQFSELSAFGGKKPSSVFAGVINTLDLTALQAGQERLMQTLGLSAESRRFTPHVTLGRCRKVKPEAVARYLGQHGSLFAQPFMPARFVLYSAKESTGGGPYAAEAWWPLESASIQKPTEAHCEDYQGQAD